MQKKISVCCQARCRQIVLPKCIRKTSESVSSTHRFSSHGISLQNFDRPSTEYSQETKCTRQPTIQSDNRTRRRARSRKIHRCSRSGEKTQPRHRSPLCSSPTHGWFSFLTRNPRPTPELQGSIPSTRRSLDIRRSGGRRFDHCTPPIPS